MESNDLARAAESRAQLTDALRLPGGFPVWLGTATTVQLATAAYGIARQDVAGLAVAALGVVLFLSIAVVLLRQFGQRNGVRVHGLTSRAVLGTSTLSSLCYAAALAGATWAAFSDAWWLVAVAAVAGGTGYAAAALHWWQRYRRDPAGQAGTEAPYLVVALVALAGAGAVLLVLAR